MPPQKDVFINGTDSGQEDAGKNKTDLSIVSRPGTLYRYRDSIADPKYEGVTTARRSLMEEDSAQEASEEDDDGIGSDAEDEQVAPRELEDDDEIEKEDEDGHQTESSDGVAGYPLTSTSQNAGHEEQEQDISADLRKKRDEDKRKGKAVSRQIAIQDTLLEARIRMQKAVSVTNLLPAPSDMDAYIQQPECREAPNKMLDEALSLADELSELQEVSSTIIVWYRLTRCSVLLSSNRNAFSKWSQHLKSAVELAEETLNEYDKLLSRTRTWRGKERRIGTTIEGGQGTVNEEDPDRFDDTDFYQQLLRDVIDSRGNGGVDDWMAIQKEKRAKKKVDTRASKGQKIRYHVHEKMQNFMVPVPIVGAWHEQIDELFSSLLGKGYEVEAFS